MRLLLLLLPLLVSCMPESSPLTFSESSTSRGSSFQDTVYPILQSNCVACHASVISPYIAHKDVVRAEDYILQGSKVDFNTPTNSRLYQRLKTDLHNCNGKCEKLAADMLAAIIAWKKGVPTSDDLPSTAEKSFGQLHSTPAEINSTHFFEAENLVLKGRFFTKSSMNASSLKYITSNTILDHPYSPSTRFGYMETSCNIRPQSDQYHVKNYKTHYPNANGYPPYFYSLNFYLIRPDRRVQYRALLLSNPNPTLDEVLPLTWGKAGFTTADMSKPMIGVTQGQNLDTSFLHSPNIFPQGYSIEMLNDHLFNRKDLAADYFAPDSNGMYPRLNTQGLRQTLSELQASQQFIQRALFPVVARHIRTFFFDGASARTIPNYNALEFVGQTGEAGFNAAFPLSYLDSGNIINGDANNPIHKLDEYVFITMASSPTFNPSYQGVVPEGRIFDPCASTAGNNTSLLVACFNSEARNFGTPHYFNIADPNLSHDSGTKNQSYDTNAIIFPSQDVSEQVEEAKFNAYVLEIYPHLTEPSNRCVQCHNGQVSSIPKFAVQNPRLSYNEMNHRLNYDIPDESNLYVHINNFHNNNEQNCVNQQNCTSLAQSFITSLRKTKASIALINNTASQNEVVRAVSPLDLIPGSLEFEFKVTKTDNYKFYFKNRFSQKVNSTYDQYHTNFAIYDSGGRVVQASTGNKQCFNFPVLSRNTEIWNWYGESQNASFPLTTGNYKLKIFERMEGVAIDQIAISSSPNFSGNENRPSQPAKFETFEFDLENLTGIPDSKIQISYEDYQDYYKFSKPRILSTQDIWVEGVFVSVNNDLAPYDLTFASIKKRVTDNSPLSAEALLVKKKSGIAYDKIKIQFKVIRKAGARDITPLPPTDERENTKKCRDIAYFKRNIQPLFDRLEFETLREDAYYGYFQNFIFASKQKTLSNRSSFFNGDYDKTCVHCHFDRVPKFEMNYNNPVQLCEEVLKRTNFSEPEISIIFRGIYGMFKHPESFQFSEEPELDGNGNWMDDNDQRYGKKITFTRSDILEMYDDYDSLFNPATNTCRANHTANLNSSNPVIRKEAEDNEKYIRTFIGTVKKEMFELITSNTTMGIYNGVYTLHDKELERRGMPLPLVSEYLDPSPPNCAFPQICDDRRANFKRPFYPADYFCGKTSAQQVNLKQRIFSGTMASCYSTDLPTQFRSCRNMLTPDGQQSNIGIEAVPFLNYNINKYYITYPRTIDGRHSLFVPVLRSSVDLNDLRVHHKNGVINADGSMNDSARDKVRQMIIDWINHEKSLMPASSP